MCQKKVLSGVVPRPFEEVAMVSLPWHLGVLPLIHLLVVGMAEWAEIRPIDLPEHRLYRPSLGPMGIMSEQFNLVTGEERVWVIIASYRY